jgi:pimeloyl-ACP methyl ester carboxylesterase
MKGGSPTTLRESELLGDIHRIQCASRRTTSISSRLKTSAAAPHFRMGHKRRFRDDRSMSAFHSEKRFLHRAGRTLSRDFAIIHYALQMFPAEVLGDDALWNKLRPIVARDYSERDGRDLAEQWQACLDYESLDRLPSCKVPLHVIAFSQDVQTPPACSKVIADIAPKGHFHLLEGLGHCSAFGHRPDVVNSCIGRIIDSHVAAEGKARAEPR